MARYLNLHWLWTFFLLLIRLKKRNYYLYYFYIKILKLKKIIFDNGKIFHSLMNFFAVVKNNNYEHFNSANPQPGIL